MEPTEHYQNKVETLKRAVEGLAASLEVNPATFDTQLSDLVKCGHVQKFEYCAELLWKTIKLWLVQQEITDVNSPKAVIKSYYQTAQISDAIYEELLATIHHRNRFSHVYNQDEFDQLYLEITNHLKTMQYVVSQL